MTQLSHLLAAKKALKYNYRLSFDTVRELREDIREMWSDHNFQQRLGSIRKLIKMFAGRDSSVSPTDDASTSARWEEAA